MMASVARNSLPRRVGLALAAPTPDGHRLVPDAFGRALPAPAKPVVR
jgi:hypothetical protein